jgi:hypothetical protein
MNSTSVISTLMPVIQTMQVFISVGLGTAAILSIKQYTEDPQRNPISKFLKYFIGAMIIYLPNFFITLIDDTVSVASPINHTSEPIDWTFLIYIAIAVGGIAGVCLFGYFTYMLTLIVKCSTNLKLSKKYLELDETFTTIATYIEPLKKQVDKNKKIVEKLPDRISSKLYYINNILEEKKLKYDNVILDYQRRFS